MAETRNKKTGAVGMRFWLRAFCSVCIAAAVVVGAVPVGFGPLGSATTAYAQRGVNIVVRGNRRVDAATIRTYFRLNPGERLDAVKIDEAWKALLATGLFEDVQVTQSGGGVIVTVVEAAVINRIAFEGNRAVKDEQLNQEIQSKPRGALSRQTVRSDVQRIIDIYRVSGRYDVTVTPKIIELANGRVDLVFEIREGKKTTVRDISFVGNRAFSSSRLKDVIKTAQTGLLSFLRTNDIYDADRIEADRDLIRRHYLKNGYADVRVVSAVAAYDPARRGFNVVFTIDEGPHYRFGRVDIQSNVREVDPARLRSQLKMRGGGGYDADAVEKSVEAMTIELARGGYPFAAIRPRGDRNFEARTIDVVFVVDQGARSYIERINVRGNTRTQEHVIRREFDIGEGDAYNHAMIERAERRLKNLGFFKTVRISSEPGSAPDRIIVVVDVEEQSTGEFSVAGGYSTADGFLAEVSVAERNLLGRGQFARAAVTYGQRARGFELSFVEPYLLGYRLAFGVDAFYKTTLPSSYQSYESQTAGAGIKFGIPITEELSTQLRYTAYQQEIKISSFNNCYPLVPSPTVPVGYALPDGTFIANCLPVSAAFRKSANDGAAITSLIGYTLMYNTLDNVRNPTKGLILEFKQDFAGVGGDVNFVRSTIDARFYYDIGWDVVALLRGQAGHIMSWGGQTLRSLDHFFMGPNLVRGFAPYGFGPRDVSPNSLAYDALGGSMYWGTSLEFQYPLPFAPKDFGMKLAVFADAGSVWNYRGIKSYLGPFDCQVLACYPGQAVPGQIIQVRDVNTIRSSVGVGLIWDSPLGPLRFEYAVALTKDNGVLVTNVNGVTTRVGDQIQEFRFSGGSKF